MERMTRKTVMLVDPHPAGRRIFGRALPPEYHLIAEAGTPVEAIDVLRTLQPAIVVTDVLLPDVSSVSLLRYLGEHCPAIRTIVFTGSHDTDVLLQILRERPDGFVHAMDPYSVLQATLDVVAHGGTLLSPVANDLLKRHPPADPPPWNHLTARDLLITQLVAQGASCKDIANALHIAPKTAEHYRSHVLQKLAIPTAVALTRFAYNHKLLRPNELNGHVPDGIPGPTPVTKARSSHPSPTLPHPSSRR